MLGTMDGTALVLATLICKRAKADQTIAVSGSSEIVESLRPTSADGRESTQERQSHTATAAVRMRLWTYGGQQGKLRDLLWSGDQQLAGLIQKVIGGGQGTIVEEYPSIVVAHFGDAIHALATAKSLQQQLLALHREPPDQVVTAIVVDDQCALTAPGATPVLEALLAEANCAQILVSERIYDLAKNIPGFDLSSKPVREAAEDGPPEDLYELRWTDESTYGHLRKTSRGAGPALSRDRRYTVQSELGRGCMGVVYKAYDEVIGRLVALKTIAVNRSFPNHNELIERLKQEAKAAGSLDHPNIITVFDVGQEDDLIYLSMQYVEGKTLMALLSEGSLPPLMDLLSYAEQICNAVGFAHHKGVIHRDLKPANFMLTSQGVIKVLDFGIAKLEDATLTQTGMIVGTPTYMAPEQAKAKKVDQRSDIFSLGSVFYELFTREKPFKGDITTVLYKLIHEDPPPPSVINPALPMGIDAIIRKALAKNPDERFQNCEEMREAFRQQAVLLQQGTATQRVTPAQGSQRAVTIDDLLEEVKPRQRRSHRPVWITMAVGLLVASMGAGSWAFRVKARTGSFPPALARVITALRPAKAQFGAAIEQQAPAQASTAQTATVAADAGQHATENSVSGKPSAVDQGNALPATTTPDTQKTQTPENSPDQPAPSTQVADATPADSEKPAADLNPFEPRKRNQKAAVVETGDEGAKVEGFSRKDIPDLLNRANEAAGTGNYSQAKYAYGIVLKLDRQNAAARTGLKRVLAAEQER